MPRKPKPKSGAGKWTDGLDPKEVRAALEDATVDAYDEYEQHSGLLNMVQDQLAFPFRARVLGEELDVVDMEWPEDDEFGLDLVCQRDGRRHRVEGHARRLQTRASARNARRLAGRLGRGQDSTRGPIAGPPRARVPGLLGLEGNAARLYFENLAGMLKVGPKAAEAEPLAAPARPRESGPRGHATAAEPTATPTAAGGPDGCPPSEDGALSFDFASRNRRPPRDPVNALLSLAYSLLAKDLTIVTQAVGFDLYLGYFHQPRFGRASLALDLMEPFRPLIADSAVLSAINTRMVTVHDFVRTGNAVALTADGRKKFFRAYEQRMDTLVTHPLFGYRANYRRLLEIQTRLLARVLTGEMSTYPVFTTR
jgi:CRISP-associated protein Cas1